MGEINRALGAEGFGIKLTILGKEWTMAYVTQRMKGEMESWLEGRARKKLIAAKPVLDREGNLLSGIPSEDYQERVSLVEENIASGVYSWSGKPMQKALHSVITGMDGIHQLGFILLKSHHPDLTLSDVEALVTAEPDIFCLAVKDALKVRDLNPNLGSQGKEPVPKEQDSSSPTTKSP